MKWTLLLLGVFLVQEPLSANAVVLEAYQHGYNVWLIHLLFVLMTLFDIVVGYGIGKFIRERCADTRFTRYAERKAKQFSDMVGTEGKRVAIILYGPILFPISAILAPWLDINFKEALIYMFIGELLLWYLFVWIVVLGVHTFIPNPAVALYAILALTLAIIFWRRYKHKNKNAKN